MLLVVLLLISQLLAWSDGAECGLLDESRIVGGEDTGGMTYPWFALIRRSKSAHCGGAMITSSHVLSAAHCFDVSYAEGDKIPFDVAFNVYNWCKRKEKNRRVFEIKSIVRHENFSNIDNLFNDISIVTLKEKTDIPLICLPSAGPILHEPGMIIGFGYTSENSLTLPCKLRRANATKYTIEECKSTALPDSTFAEETVFCAGAPGIDTCGGDSGGPFLTQSSTGSYIVTGIVSYGYGCAQETLPGVYTNVASFLDWIKVHTDNLGTTNNTRTIASPAKTIASPSFEFPANKMIPPPQQTFGNDIMPNNQEFFQFPNEDMLQMNDWQAIQPSMDDQRN